MAVRADQLLARLPAQARLLVGVAGLGREVTGLSDLRGHPLSAPPPLPPGRAILLSAGSLPTARDRQRALTARWRHAALAVVEVTDAAEAVPIGFLAAAEQSELPLVRWLPASGQDPIHELRAALRADTPPLPGLADWAHHLGVELDAEVHVLDARLRPLTGAPPAPASALSQALAVLPPAVGHDPLFRIALQVGGHQARVRSVNAGGEVQAVLIALSARPLDAARLDVLDRAVGELAARLNANRPPAPHELVMLQAGMRLLIKRALESSVWRKVVEEFRLPQSGPYAMVVLTGAPSSVLAATLEEVWGLGRWVTPCETPEGMVLVGRAEIFLDAASLVAGMVARLGEPVHAGLAELAHRRELGIAYEQARAAARQAVRRQLPLVTHGELGWRELVPATVDPAGVELLRSRLLDSFEAAAGGDVLLETLRTWVREEHRNDRTARLLGVHRHTLHNRLQRCERLLGAPLDAPDTAFGLWLLFRDAPGAGSP